MDRRRAIRLGGLGLMAAAGGCATSTPAAGPPRAGLRTGRLVPVRASLDRVIRTTVGLRPYRPQGFRLEVERLDEKTVIHNYGHGGAGHSLAWGTAQLAADLAVQHPARRATVLGCGVAGLTSAIELQRRGFRVAIVAEHVPPETTSNKAWAGFTPGSGVIANAERTPAWDARFRRAVELAYHRLQLLTGRGYGVSWIDSYSFLSRAPSPQSAPSGNPLVPAGLTPAGAVLGPGEHPFPTPYARQRPTLRIEPAIYMDALVRDFRDGGGTVAVTRLESLEQVAALGSPLILNCTGLGSRELFGDAALTPVKGQLTILIPQRDVRYSTLGGIPGRAGGGGRFPLHMMPRNDGIALGGTSEEGVWSLDPDAEAMRRVVAGHAALFDAMRL